MFPLWQLRYTICHYPSSKGMQVRLTIFLLRCCRRDMVLQVVNLAASVARALDNSVADSYILQSLRAQSQGTCSTTIVPRPRILSTLGTRRLHRGAYLAEPLSSRVATIINHDTGVVPGSGDPSALYESRMPSSISLILLRFRTVCRLTTLHLPPNILESAPSCILQVFGQDQITDSKLSRRP